MIESPLKRYKRNYPIDFTSSNQNEFKSQNNSKYDIITYQHNSNAKQNSNQSQHYQNPQMRRDISLDINNKNNFKIKSNGGNKFQTSIRIQKPFQFTTTFDSINVEQPLQQINKKSKVQIDEKLLINARFQNKVEEQLLNIKTFESISPNTTQIKKGGNIKHQNLQNMLCNVKQEPLLPQNPFKIGVISQKQKYLQKLGMNSNFHVQQKTSFSQRHYQKGNDIKRANSSFQMRLNNSKELNKNLDNLPNVFNRSNSKFSNFNQQNNKYKQYLKKTQFIKTDKSIFENKNKKNQQQVSQFKFQPNIISKLKKQINQITQTKMQKRSNSMNMNQKQQKVIQKQRQRQRQYTFNENQNQKILRMNNEDNNAMKRLPKIQITYHTTLVSLKNIIKKFLKQSQQFQLTFKIPKIFISDELFWKQQSKEQLHQNSLRLFEALKIQPKNMVTKRYSNCILFICQNIIVIWNYNGKRFLGGWQYTYLNQGSKHGLGLQWQPNSHIYYGEFKQNKKHGIGAMKQGGNKITVGYWYKGKYIGKTQHQENSLDDRQQTISDEDWRQSAQLSHFGLQSRFNQYYQDNS